MIPDSIGSVAFIMHPSETHDLITTVLEDPRILMQDMIFPYGEEDIKLYGSLLEIVFSSEAYRSGLEMDISGLRGQESKQKKRDSRSTGEKSTLFSKKYAGMLENHLYQPFDFGDVAEDDVQRIFGWFKEHIRPGETNLFYNLNDARTINDAVQYNLSNLPWFDRKEGHLIKKGKCALIVTSHAVGKTMFPRVIIPPDKRVPGVLSEIVTFPYITLDDAANFYRACPDSVLKPSKTL